MHTWPSISIETMELPLVSVSDCEVCACGETAVEIHHPISAVYSEERRTSKSKVCHWVRDSKGGRTEVHNTARTGGPSDAVNKNFQNLYNDYCHAGLQKLHK